MWLLAVVTASVLQGVRSQDNELLRECAYLYRSKNYFDVIQQNVKLPPYVGQMAMPNNLKDLRDVLEKIAPTPVVTTKVIELKTKYVYKNPICVKYTKKQKLCVTNDVKLRQNIDKLLIKDDYLQGDLLEDNVEAVVDIPPEVDDFDNDKFNLQVSFSKLDPSESEEGVESRAFRLPTPAMNPHKMKELLIEDRLDQLETILPNYHRRRAYETKTVYVTKTISNKRNMATLVVKNCIPVGYDVCPKATKSRKNLKTSNLSDWFYFG